MGHGVTALGIRKLCMRFQETGSVANQAGRGRKKLTTPKTDSRISRMALSNRRASAGDINKLLKDAGVNVSDRTVRRRLVTVRLRARVARKKPFLNVEQRQKRVAWANNTKTGRQKNGKELFGVMKPEYQSSAATAFGTSVDDLEKTFFRSA